MGYFLFSYQDNLFFYPVSLRKKTCKNNVQWHRCLSGHETLKIEQGNRQESTAGTIDPTDDRISDDQFPLLIHLLHVLTTQITDRLEFVLPVKKRAALVCILT